MNDVDKTSMNTENTENTENRTKTSLTASISDGIRNRENMNMNRRKGIKEK